MWEVVCVETGQVVDNKQYLEKSLAEYIAVNLTAMRGKQYEARQIAEATT